MKKKEELRAAQRFLKIGRVDSLQICALPGVLDDISLTGCRVHFPNPISLDKENEYTLLVRVSSDEVASPLELIAKPIWNTTGESESEIGFSFLRSPDTPELSRYIEILQETSDDDSDITSLIINQDAIFI